MWEGEDEGYFLLLVYCMCDHLEEQKWQYKVDKWQLTAAVEGRDGKMLHSVQPPPPPLSAPGRGGGGWSPNQIFKKGEGFDRILIFKVSWWERGGVAIFT